MVELLSWLSSVRRPSLIHNGCIVAKRCKIGPKLILVTNRKLHTGFQMTYKSLTLKVVMHVWQRKTGHISETVQPRLLLVGSERYALSD